MWVSEPSDPGFPKKPTPDKYSTSECLKGKASLVSGATRVFANICRFPLMRPKILLCTSHGKGCAEIWMKQHSSQTRFPHVKMVEGNILMSHKEHFVPRAALMKSQGLLRGWHTKQELNWRILNQHLKDITGRVRLINWFALTFILLFKIRFWTLSPPSENTDTVRFDYVMYHIIN